MGAPVSAVNVIPLNQPMPVRSGNDALSWTYALQNYNANGVAPAPYNPDLYQGMPLVSPNLKAYITWNEV